MDKFLDEEQNLCSLKQGSTEVDPFRKGGLARSPLRPRATGDCILDSLLLNIPDLTTWCETAKRRRGDETNLPTSPSSDSGRNRRQARELWAVSALKMRRYERKKAWVTFDESLNESVKQMENLAVLLR